MINGFTSPVRAQENSSNTTSATHSNRARRHRFGSGDRQAHNASRGFDLPLGRGSQMIEISRDGRRVSRTRSTRHGTRSSTPTAPAHGWPSLTPISPRAVWCPMSDSSRTASISAACGSINPGCKAAARPATRTATPAARPPAGVDPNIVGADAPCAAMGVRWTIALSKISTPQAKPLL